MLVKALEITAYLTASVLLVVALVSHLLHKQPFHDLAALMDGSWSAGGTLAFLFIVASATALIGLPARSR